MYPMRCPDLAPSFTKSAEYTKSVRLNRKTRPSCHWKSDPLLTRLAVLRPARRPHLGRGRRSRAPVRLGRLVGHPAHRVRRQRRPGSHEGGPVRMSTRIEYLRVQVRPARSTCPGTLMMELIDAIRNPRHESEQRRSAPSCLMKIKCRLRGLSSRPMFVEHINS
jgi:hypothetical protein